MEKRIKKVAIVGATIVTLAGFAGLCGECQHQLLWSGSCILALLAGGKALDKLGVFDTRKK